MSMSTPGYHGEHEGDMPFCSSVNETLAKLFENRPVYAASRINQLRKSSSAASQLRKINRISYLRGWPFDALLGLVSSVTCGC